VGHRIYIGYSGGRERTPQEQMVEEIRHFCSWFKQSVIKIEVVIKAVAEIEKLQQRFLKSQRRHEYDAPESQELLDSTRSTVKIILNNVFKMTVKMAEIQPEKMATVRPIQTRSIHTRPGKRSNHMQGIELVDFCIRQSPPISHEEKMEERLPTITGINSRVAKDIMKIIFTFFDYRSIARSLQVCLLLESNHYEHTSCVRKAV